GVQVGPLAAADSGDEVGVVSGSRGLLTRARRRVGHWRVATPWKELHTFVLAAGHERAALQMDDVADPHAADIVALEAANLEDELRFTIIENGYLRVRRLGLVGVAETAAETDDAPGE